MDLICLSFLRHIPTRFFYSPCMNLWDLQRNSLALWRELPLSNCRCLQGGYWLLHFCPGPRRLAFHSSKSKWSKTAWSEIVCLPSFCNLSALQSTCCTSLRSWIRPQSAEQILFSLGGASPLHWERKDILSCSFFWTSLHRTVYSCVQMCCLSCYTACLCYTFCYSKCRTFNPIGRRSWFQSQLSFWRVGIAGRTWNGQCGGCASKVEFLPRIIHESVSLSRTCLYLESLLLSRRIS